MSDTATTARRFNWGRFLVVNLPYIALYCVSIWLLALTDSDPATASTDWQLFIPVVALVSIIGGWRYAGLGSRGKSAYVIKQVLHWGTLIVVINLLFLHAMQDFLNAEAHGFVIIYLLGLAAVLSGIYLDWKMAVFGAFLILSAVGIGWIEDNVMLILSVIGVALVGVVLSLVLFSKHKSKTMAS